MRISQIIGLIFISAGMVAVIYDIVTNKIQRISFIILFYYLSSISWHIFIL